MFRAQPRSELSKFINAYKSASSRLLKKEYPWLKEADSLALANVQRNLEGAFRKSYTTNMVNGNICLQEKSLKLQKMTPIKIKLHRSIPEC